MYYKSRKDSAIGILSVAGTIILCCAVMVPFTAKGAAGHKDETVVPAINASRYEGRMAHVWQLDCGDNYIEPAQSESSLSITDAAVSIALGIPIVERTAVPVEPDAMLPVYLQEHTLRMSRKYDIPYEILMAIMYHESRFIVDVKDNMNTNGTLDRGLCQINEVNWSWLLNDYSLDVNIPEDNIESAALILSLFMERHTLETSLASYAAGETGAVEFGGGFWFPEKIIPMSENYIA